MLVVISLEKSYIIGLDSLETNSKNQNVSVPQNLIEVYCSSGQFMSAKLKNKEYTINASSFFTIWQKKIEAKNFSRFAGRWSAVDLCCSCSLY